jgi:hypothetical protein
VVGNGVKLKDLDAERGCRVTSLKRYRSTTSEFATDRH